MDNNRPAVSVIMPVYNTASYVEEAIKSVTSQTFQEFELLLINDGSTDNSLSILEDWAREDSRIRVYSQTNQGLSSARNTGIFHARGKYVYFMDSDDIIIPHTLQSCYTICEKEQLDFTFFDAEVFADTFINPDVLQGFKYIRKHFIPNLAMPGKTAFDQLLSRDEFFSSVCLLFINSTFLNQINLTFEKGIVHEDQLFTALLFFNASRVAYNPTSFFLRRVRMDSIMTTTYNMKNIHSYFVVGHKLLQYTKKNKSVEDLVDIYLKGMIDAAVWKAYKMPLKDRLHIFMLCLRDWSAYVHWKTFLVLFFKKYK